MNWRSRQIWLVVGALGALGLVAWPGCATPPLPSSRKPIAARNAADFKFAKSARPNRFEVITRLGQPDAYLSDVRVACYRVNNVTRRNLWLALFVIPVNVTKHTNYVDVAFLEFDEQDQMKRSGMVTTRDFTDFKWAAKQWLAEAQPKAHKAPKAR